MNWLIWKEYRLNRLIVIVGAFLLLLPYAAAAAFLAWHWRGILAAGAPTWRQILAGVTLYSLGISQLTVALLGGNAIACERVDRSAEFLAYLPVSRGRTLAAKILFALAVLSVIWLPNLAILAISVPLDVWIHGEARTALLILGNTSAIGLAFFGVGWLLSSILESPTFSTCGGLMAPFLTAGIIGFSGHLLGYVPAADPRPVLFCFYVLCVALALTGFVAGTVYYLRRVEP